MTTLNLHHTAPVRRIYSAQQTLPRSPVFETRAYMRLRSWIRTRRLERRSIAVIKLLHTLVFLSLLVCVFDVTWSGMRGRISRQTRISMAAVAGEALIFGASGRQCPLTVLVEDLGADHGQVTDIFLPDVLARHIFGISTTLLGIGAGSYALRRILPTVQISSR